MKRLLILLALTIAAATQARERSEEEMMAAAASVLPRPAMVRDADGRPVGTPMMTLRHGRSLRVMGYSDGGFAVVATDDDVEAVLGYSLTSYDSISVPPALEWWLESVEQTLEARPQYTRAATAEYNRTGVSELAPMLPTKWGQTEPYNLLCPKRLLGEGHMVTGCIATSMSQIMYHYAWPLQGEGGVKYDILHHVCADYDLTTYDWGNILPVYEKGQYTEAEADAVATLMLHCGMAVNMRYTDSESGSQGQYVPGAMRKYFGYHPNVGYRNRADHTNVEWLGSIYRELVAGRPILYTGTDKSYGGHAFVFDGFDSEGMVHVNWGWDGKFDGYFDINLLNSGNNRMCFAEDQAMIVGIGMADDNTIEHSVELAIRQDLELSGSGRNYKLDTSNLLVWCLNDYDLVGTLAVVMPTPTGTRVLTTIESFSADDPMRSFYTLLPQYPEYSVNIPIGLANGTYYFYLAFREEGRDDWLPLYAAEGVVGFYQLIKQGSSYTVNAVVGQYADLAMLHGVRGSHWWDDSTDAIQPATAADVAAPMFNLAGQRVNHGYRGVVVQDGHKYINR